MEFQKVINMELQTHFTLAFERTKTTFFLQLVMGQVNPCCLTPSPYSKSGGRGQYLVFIFFVEGEKYANSNWTYIICGGTNIPVQL
jgi:hypothetical protein